MSIANEIQRLQGSKANIKSAIEEKGVTVGDGTIDTYADLIRQITTSGGGLKYASGTVEFADSNNCVFYHNLGVVPRIVLLWTEATEDNIGKALGCILDTITPFGFGFTFENNNGTARGLQTGTPVPELTDTYAKVRHRSGSFLYAEGITYNWLVIE